MDPIVQRIAALFGGLGLTIILGGLVAIALVHGDGSEQAVVQAFVGIAGTLFGAGTALIMTLIHKLGGASSGGQ